MGNKVFNGLRGQSHFNSRTSIAEATLNTIFDMK